MTVDLTLPDGVTLAYLRNYYGGKWEAMVRRRLDGDGIGTGTGMSIAYAVGFGTDHNPDHALTYALEALERDPQLISQALVEPTCAPTISEEALANLLSLSPMPPSKPLFKLKAS